MDIKSLLKKLDISYVKMLTMSIFNRSGLYEYLLDKANTAVNTLLSANQDTVSAIRQKLATINSYLVRYTDCVSACWLSDAQRINELLLAVYRATDDGQIVSDEAKLVVEKFQIAYSGFKSDEE